MKKLSLGPTKLYAVSNYGNFAVTVLLNLWITPILLAGLGAAQFGLWKTCLRFLDFSATADGRPTQALKWVIAHRSSDPDDAAKRRLVGASMIVWLMWIPVLLTVLGLTIFATPYLIGDITPAEATTARITATVLALSALVGGLIGIPEAVLIGSNQGHRPINIRTIFLIASMVCMAAAATYGYGTVALAAIMGLGTGLAALFAWVSVRRRIAWWGARKPTRSETGALARFSGWTLVWMIVHQFMLSTELLLFAYLLGLTEVARYSITAYASQSALAVCLLTGSAMIPGLAAMIGARRGAEAATRVRQTREIVMAIALVAGCGILLFNRSFVSLWAGEEYYLGPVLNGLIVLAFCQVAIVRCDAQILDATLNVRRRAIYGAAISAIALFGGILAYRLTASIEASYVAMLGARLVLHLVYALDVNRQVSGAGYPLGKSLIVLAMLAASYGLGRDLVLDGWLELIAFAAAGGLVLSLASLAILGGQTRQAILNFAPIGKPR